MPTPAAYVAPDAKWQTSVENAVRAAEAEITAANKGAARPSEQAGFIVRNQDGKYAYSVPVQNGDHDNFGFRAQIQKGQQMVAIYHNHLGADDLAQYFSPNDLNVAQHLNLPSYVFFNGAGNVRRYTPGATKTFRLPGVPGYVANGDALPKPPDPLQEVATQPAPSDPLQDFSHGG